MLQDIDYPSKTTQISDGYLSIIIIVYILRVGASSSLWIDPEFFLYMVSSPLWIYVAWITAPRTTPTSSGMPQLLSAFDVDCNRPWLSFPNLHGDCALTFEVNWRSAWPSKSSSLGSQFCPVYILSRSLRFNSLLTIAIGQLCPLSRSGYLHRSAANSL